MKQIWQMFTSVISSRVYEYLLYYSFNFSIYLKFFIIKPWGKTSC